MLILTFEEFNNKFNIDNSAISDIRIKDIGKDISLTPIEIVMRDETPDNINEPNFNIIVNLHPTEGTYWALVIRREGGPTYYFDSFGVETPLLFLKEYVDIGSNERIQQYDESYCGAYCLYMIFLIDRGFRNKSDLNILINQCKYPGIYNECFCLGCNINDNVNVNDLRSSFANDVNDNDNDNDKSNDNDNDNDNDIDKDSVKENVHDKDNDLRISFTNNDNDNDIVNDNDNVNDNNNNNNNNNNDNDNDIDNDNDTDKDNFIYQGTCLADLFDEKHGETWQAKPHQKGKPNNNSPNNNISVYINDDLQSWLNDDDIIAEAEFPDNIRCIISGPSECGKAFLLKKLILASIYFDKLYIIGPTGDQYNGLERINPKAI